MATKAILDAEVRMVKMVVEVKMVRQAQLVLPVTEAAMVAMAKPDPLDLLDLLDILDFKALSVILDPLVPEVSRECAVLQEIQVTLDPQAQPDP